MQYEINTHDEDVDVQIEVWCEVVQEWLDQNDGVYVWETYRGGEVKENIHNAKKLLMDIVDRLGDYRLAYSIENNVLKLAIYHHDAPMGFWAHMLPCTWIPCAVCGGDVLTSQRGVEKELGVEEQGVIFCTPHCAQYLHKPWTAWISAVNTQTNARLAKAVAVNADEGEKVMVQYTALGEPVEVDGYYTALQLFTTGYTQKDGYSLFSISKIGEFQGADWQAVSMQVVLDD